jgi:hypothetical protein
VSNQPARAADPADSEETPAGAAIVRPLRHVRAVRERHLQQLGDRSRSGQSPSAQAWSWALGETAFAPVTGAATMFRLAWPISGLRSLKPTEGGWPVTSRGGLTARRQCCDG